MMLKKSVIRPYGRSMVSRTRPNMALTVRQINERFALGKPVPPTKTPIIEPEIINGVNPLRMKYVDYTDLFEYGELLSTKLNEQTALLTEKQKEFAMIQSRYKQDLFSKLNQTKEVQEK